MKLLGLYLMDSIMKNHKYTTNYNEIFETKILGLFVHVFESVSDPFFIFILFYLKSSQFFIKVFFFLIIILNKSLFFLKIGYLIWIKLTIKQYAFFVYTFFFNLFEFPQFQKTQKIGGRTRPQKALPAAVDLEWSVHS